MHSSSQMVRVHQNLIHRQGSMQTGKGKTEYENPISLKTMIGRKNIIKKENMVTQDLKNWKDMWDLLIYPIKCLGNLLKKDLNSHSWSLVSFNSHLCYKCTVKRVTTVNTIYQPTSITLNQKPLYQVPLFKQPPVLCGHFLMITSLTS